MSVVASALVAICVAFGSSMALVAEAARHVGASPAEVASWITATCLGIAAMTGFLSVRHRMPIISGWSIAGAVLTLSLPAGTTMGQVIGGFLFAAVLMVLAGAVPALEAAVARLPASIGGAMLAGLLLRFVLATFQAAQAEPALVLPLLAVFLVAREIYPASGPLVVIAVGLLLARVLDLPMAPSPPVGLSHLAWMPPAFDLRSLIGFGVPFFLVTMATQQLPGFAVLRVSGYPPPVRPILLASGLITLATAPFGGFSVNLSSVTASICTGPDAHADPAKRWLTGPIYAAGFLLLAAFGGSLVTLLTALPPPLFATILGVALIGPMTGALTVAVAHERQRFAAVLAFCVTASGMSLLGIGAAFWGLVAGGLALGLDRLARAWRRR